MMRQHRLLFDLGVVAILAVGFFPILPVHSAAQERAELTAIYTTAVTKYLSPQRLANLTDWNGDITWGSSGALDSLVSAYEATRDINYLKLGEQLIRSIIAARDDKRGIQDFSGKVTVFWSNKKYNLGKIEFQNPGGAPFLVLESVSFASANLTTVTVTREEGDTLTIVAENPGVKATETYLKVPMAEVTRRINTTKTNDKLIWVKSFSPEDARSFQGSTKQATDVYVYSWPTHHIGWITAPMLRWCWVVRRSGLEEQFPSVKEFVVSLRETLTSPDLEKEFVKLPVRGGYYRIPVGVPIWCDGIIEPFNTQTAIGRSFYFLWKLTGTPWYLDRTKQLVAFWRSSWKTRNDGSAEWPYWVGQGAEGWNPGNMPGKNTQSWKGTPQPAPAKYAASDITLITDALLEGDALLPPADLTALGKTVERMLDKKCVMPWRVDGVGSDEFTQQSHYVVFRHLVARKVPLNPSIIEECARTYKKKQDDLYRNPTQILTVAEFLRVLP